MPRRLEPQADLYPHMSGDGVLLHLAQLTTRITRLGPELRPEQCYWLHADLALIHAKLDTYESYIVADLRARAERYAIVA